jgi:hypothetical protein
VSKIGLYGLIMLVISSFFHIGDAVSHVLRLIVRPKSADELNVIQCYPGRLNSQLISLAAQEDIHEKAICEKV